jgi:hypothetical protein
MPASSPWAPAPGCRVTASIPVISASRHSRAAINSRPPWHSAAGSKGCALAKPGMAAWRSLVLGLYFIVQEPSGYNPVSTEKFHEERRV